MKKLIKVLIAVSLIFVLSLSTGLIAEASAEVSEVSEEAAPDEENVFSRLWDTVSSYATEIFCAMTFTGSLILAYAYKKGLLPLVEKTLVSIGGAVSKIKERTESSELAAERIGTEMEKKLAGAESLILTLTERVNEMNDSLLDVKAKEHGWEQDAKSLSVIVSAQVDMLYDIFMSSALPQYQKDAVGERVAKMKEALRKDGTE